MSDNGEATLVRSYRGTVEAFRGLLTIAESLASAHRAGRVPSAAELAHIEDQVVSARAKIDKIDVFLALWPETDGQVH